MSAAQIVVAHDVRHWTTFNVLDATPEELAILEQTDSEEAAALASAMYDAKRLEWFSTEEEDNPHLFEDHRAPAVIEFEEGGA